MKSITTPLWPEGRIHAVTFSYDDGRIHDRKLVDVFNRHGLKATFNLNAGKLGSEGVVALEDIKSLYAGHEVACHFLTHPYPTRIPAERRIFEVMEDRKILEGGMDGLVDGMAYPFGDWSGDVIQSLRACGIRYARTTQATNAFHWKPEDWLAWHPTSHDRAVTPETLKRFFTVRTKEARVRLYFIWGHSYEFDREGGWDAIEGICRDLREKGGDRLWTATNGMIRDYADAAASLRFSVNGQRVMNPSAQDVWIAVDGVPVCVQAGSTLEL